ncbi:MAG: hypothetical protein AAF490_00745 [Chloroflexota bacterium]
MRNPPPKLAREKRDWNTLPGLGQRTSSQIAALPVNEENDLIFQVVLFFVFLKIERIYALEIGISVGS